MRSLLPSIAMLASLSILFLLAGAPAQVAGGSTELPVKEIPFPCLSNNSNAESAPCKEPIAEISIATSKELYSNLANSIVLLPNGKEGFPADIVAAAFGLTPPKKSLSLRPFKFTKVRLTQELQSVKQLGALQGTLPVLTTVEVLGKRPQVFPSDYVRALFMTQLFKEKVEIVTSHPPNANILSSPFYIVLDSHYTTAARDSFNLLANAAQQHPPSPLGTTYSSHSIGPSPHLIRTSLRTDGQAQTGKGPGPTAGNYLKVADWLPQITIETLTVRMVAKRDSWRCGDWKDIAVGGTDSLPNELKEVGLKGGCVLDLSLDIPRGTVGVYRYLTVVGISEDPFACAPSKYGPKPSDGISAPRCETGLFRWGVEKNLISDGKEAPSFQLAVPSFDPQKLPKLTLGLAGEENVNFISPRDKACWCSPLICAGPEQERCEKELDR